MFDTTLNLDFPFWRNKTKWIISCRSSDENAAVSSWETRMWKMTQG